MSVKLNNTREVLIMETAFKELREYLDGKFEQIDQRLDGMDQRLINVEEQIADLKETTENSEMMLKALYFDNRDNIRKLQAVH